MISEATRAVALFADATRSAALFAFLCMQFVSGDLGKLMPGFSKATFGDYGPAI